MACHALVFRFANANLDLNKVLQQIDAPLSQEAFRVKLHSEGRVRFVLHTHDFFASIGSG